MTRPTTKEIIDLLKLEKHPYEGGYYRRTYRSAEIIAGDALPDRYETDRPFGNSIYYLFTPDSSSYLHKVKSDEIYHFYMGDPVCMLLLFPDGSGRVETLGTDLKNGQKVQLMVPHGAWQGSFLIEGGDYALVGTTLAPAFDWPDLEMADRQDLTSRYKSHSELIEKLTP